MLCAMSCPSRIACCAVGGWNLPGQRRSGTAAQFARSPDIWELSKLQEFVHEHCELTIFCQRHSILQRAEVGDERLDIGIIEFLNEAGHFAFNTSFDNPR